MGWAIERVKLRRPITNEPDYRIDSNLSHCVDKGFNNSGYNFYKIPIYQVKTTTPFRGHLNLWWQGPAWCETQLNPERVKLRRPITNEPDYRINSKFLNCVDKGFNNFGDIFHKIPIYRPKTMTPSRGRQFYLRAW